MTTLAQTRRAFLTTGAAGLALAGCVSLPDLKTIIGPPPPPQLYLLRPPLPAAGGAPVRWQLAVAVPDSPASLDTPRIALNPNATRMDYFANAAWPDRVPLLLQRVMIQAFEGTNRVSAARDTEGLSADYVLATELRNFEAQYDNLPPPVAAGQTAAPGAPPHITVEIQAKLMALPDHRIIGNLNAVQRVDASANNMDAIVAAFNQAVGRSLGQIVDWALRTPPAA